jgi:hypothetical protein
LIARGTQALLDGLRSAGPGDCRSANRTSMQQRFCAMIFGQEYASLLAKAAELAAQRERKAAARA